MQIGVEHSRIFPYLTYFVKPMQLKLRKFLFYKLALYFHVKHRQKVGWLSYFWDSCFEDCGNKTVENDAITVEDTQPIFHILWDLGILQTLTIGDVVKFL